MRPRVLVVDNYDSFTYNLVQYLGQLGAQVEVFRNDAIDVLGIADRSPDGIVLSPGPGAPKSSGVSMEVAREQPGNCPILGICLGHQIIGEVFGGNVVRNEAILHGKASSVFHRDEGLFAGLSIPFPAGRYHSLVVERESKPECLEETAWTEQGEIMGLRHRTLPIEGVQFHPESVLTPDGSVILRNWLNRLRAASGRRG